MPDIPWVIPGTIRFKLCDLYSSLLSTAAWGGTQDMLILNGSLFHELLPVLLPLGQIGGFGSAPFISAVWTGLVEQYHNFRVPRLETVHDFGGSHNGLASLSHQ